MNLFNKLFFFLFAVLSRVQKVNMPRKLSLKAIKKVEKKIKNNEENIDFFAWVPMDNSFATEMFADIKF